MNSEEESKPFIINKTLPEKEKNPTQKTPAFYERICLIVVLVLFVIVIITIFSMLSIVFQTGLSSQALIQKDNQPLKPLIDQNKYSLISLSNQLTVLLVSDPRSQLSFVALDVNAGSWLEPYEVPGLAHFLEHMEFINSKSYNETNYLDDFLSNNGGFSNAFTVEDHTNYFYSVTPGSLSESLLRFSHLFVDPVFLKESVDKESSAVNSEYLFDINSDPWKVENLLSLLTDSNHPFSRFSIGNTATLRDDPPKKGLDVTEELKKFHDSYYSANLMSLVVYSQHSLKEMKDMITNFQKIKNSNLKRPDFSQFGKPLKHLASMIKLQTFSQTKLLTLISQTDGIKKTYTKRAFEYLKYMISSSGENSFQQLLIKKGLISALECDFMLNQQVFTMFRLDFELTDLGFNKIKLILQYYQTYLSKVLNEGVTEDIYNERKFISNYTFSYLEGNTGSQDQVSQFALFLNTYPKKKVLFAEYEYDPIDEQEIKRYIQQIQDINNLLIIVSTNDFTDGEDGEFDITNERDFEQLNDNKFENHDDLYNLDFTVTKLSKADKKFIEAEDKQFFKQIQLPVPNKMLPEDFSLINVCDNLKQFLTVKQVQKQVQLENLEINPTKNSVYLDKTYFTKFKYTELPSNKKKCLDNINQLESENNKYPQLIYYKNGIESWYQLEKYYQVPKVAINFIFANQIKSSKQQVLLNLYQSILSSKLDQSLTGAQDAGNMYKISLSNPGLIFSLYGWSDTIEEFTEQFLQTINDLSMTPDDFQLAYYQNIDILQESNNDSPIQQAYSHQLQKLLVTPFFTQKSQLAILLKSTTLADVQNLHQSILNGQFQLKLLITGNLPSGQARQLTESIYSTFKDLTPQSAFNIKISNLNQGSFVFRKQVEGNDDNINSGTINYYQVGKRDIAQYTKMRLLQNTINTFMFTYLRTQRELGYSCFSKIASHYCVDGFIIGVQGAKLSPQEVDLVIEESLQELQVKIHKFSADDFNQAKLALQGDLLQRSASLLDQNEEFFGFITNSNYVFDQGDLILQQLELVTLEELIDFYDSVFINKRSKLSVQLYSKKIPFPDEDVDAEDVKTLKKTEELTYNTEKIDCPYDV